MYIDRIIGLFNGSKVSFNTVKDGGQNPLSLFYAKI